MDQYKRGTPERALSDMEHLLNNYKTSSDMRMQKKAKLLSYWISDYARMLKQEETFLPEKLKRYKRGEIVKVDLGYNIGNEEGGLHYAVVLDKENRLHSGVITVIPLSSKKVSTRINKYMIDLGDEIYQKLQTKAQHTFEECAKGMEITQNKEQGTLLISLDLKEFEKVLAEIDGMKLGSIALAAQITTVSKIRIQSPLRTTDALSNITLSAESLDKIDNKIKELYIN
jgi:hypothetical protein